MDVQARLEAAVPEYMTWLRSFDEWAWTEGDRDGRTFLLFEHLRLYLLEHRDELDVVSRAWEVIEVLTTSGDALMINALVVGLLEGWWPKRQQAMMGPRTRALWDEMRRPPRPRRGQRRP
jgi:hypothetical protein